MNRINLLLGAALVASCLWLVQTAYESRRLFAQIDRARNEHRQLEAEGKRLEAERQAQATSLRVERVARERLAMRGANAAVTQYVSDPASGASAVETAGHGPWTAAGVAAGVARTWVPSEGNTR